MKFLERAQSRRALLASMALLATMALPAGAQTDEHTKLVEIGKAIFETGVAGIPCTTCHGEDQTGLIGPVIEGGTVQMVHTALASVDAMQSLQLSLPQMVAVSAYLQSLAQAPAVAPASELVAQGKALYESSADHIGCIECHGHDQTVMVGPDLTGMDVVTVHARVDQIEAMEGVVLTLPQMVAVSAYLNSIKP